MIKLNKETYIDKLHACWLGKSIGGTMGAPYEGSRDFLDVKGFNSPSGEPLPNDDLDLQLVWLNALELEGINNISANVLGEYWVDWISPHWNEYGIAKTNLRLGLLPPVSGEIDNDKWKTSNGAWIRSEIWAGIAPCAVDVAVKYATMDSMAISNGHSANIHDISYENITVEFQKTNRPQILQETDESIYEWDGKPYMENLIKLGNWSTTANPMYKNFILSSKNAFGYTHDISYKNIYVYTDYDIGKPNITIYSESSEAPTENISIENIYLNRSLIKSFDGLNMYCKNTRNIQYNGKVGKFNGTDR